jgi:hypothetical protein
MAEQRCTPAVGTVSANEEVVFCSATGSVNQAFEGRLLVIH